MLLEELDEDFVELENRPGPPPYAPPDESELEVCGESELLDELDDDFDELEEMWTPPPYPPEESELEVWGESELLDELEAEDFEELENEPGAAPWEPPGDDPPRDESDPDDMEDA